MEDKIKLADKKQLSVFERFSNKVTHITGSSGAFMVALGVIIVWGLTGPIFNYSDTWQLVINTGTTIITFLMVFVIQKSQNKDSKSIQLKLNELIAASKGASNRLVNIEDLTEDELDILHNHYTLMAEIARRKISLHETHSAQEAEARSNEKNEMWERRKKWN